MTAMADIPMAVARPRQYERQDNGVRLGDVNGDGMFDFVYGRCGQWNSRLKYLSRKSDKITG